MVYLDRTGRYGTRFPFSNDKSQKIKIFRATSKSQQNFKNISLNKVTMKFKIISLNKENLKNISLDKLQIRYGSKKIS